MAKKRAEGPVKWKAPEDIWALPDGHHVGASNGFEKKGEAIFPAPTHAAPMESMRIDRVALEEFIDAMNRHVHREFGKIATREAAWWQAVQRDLGIKRGDAVYHYADECFRRTPKTPPDSNAVDPSVTDPGKPTPRVKESE